LAERIAQWLQLDSGAVLVPVVNATGVILDDALGRAPLAEEALEAVVAAGRSYVNLELDRSTGERLSRAAAVESLLTSLTGAEAALVVNNNTGALVLALATLAHGREVLIARGEVGELDDGHRLTDLVAASGAILREVGTANRTRSEDYAASASTQTAAVLRVRRTGYEIVGAAEETSLPELISVALRRSLPLIDNLGDGVLSDFSSYGLGAVARPADSLKAGADLVLFSGDKLLGGPQCGILLGRQPLIRQIEQHTLYRALRLDKLRLAALAATLRLLKDVELAERAIPVQSLLATPLANLRQRAERMAPQLAATGLARVHVIDARSRVLGSRLSSQAVDTICMALEPLHSTAAQLAAKLREGTQPVLARVDGERVLLDLRSVPPRDDLALVTAFEALPRAHDPKPAA
jgi:L-seryl-tRNA(Ser) seleniumtransferase